jgi:hypothetical protein
MKRRAYQTEALRGMQEFRSFFLLWRRQGGKSTTLAAGALHEMMTTPGRLVTYASASLLLGREIVLKEAEVLQRAIKEFGELAKKADLMLEVSAAGKTVETVSDGERRKSTQLKQGVNDTGLSASDFAELFESQRLEFKLWHDRTTFSRTQVIAPNPATARGWSGTVMLDEFGFIRDFRDLWEAVEPIISSDKSFRFIGATTPPKDDAHYSYELTAPALGTEFPVNAQGNWYESEAGERVHRVDIHDAYAAGQKLFDRRSGKEVSPQEHFARAEDKDAWRRNYAVQHVLGGTSAVGLLVLETAQRRGVGECAFFQIENDLEFDQAVRAGLAKLGDGPIGVGVDLATTTKESSNPTATAIVERRGVDLIVRAILIWKTADPAIALERMERICRTLKDNGTGTLRRVCIDATNERYFAADARKQLGGIAPVELVVGSEKVERPGSEPMNQKQFLGSQLVGELEDNHMWLPPERYVREDFRLVKRDRGQFVCEPDAAGRHGDTFDAVKLAVQALIGTGTEFTGETLAQVNYQSRDGSAALKREQWRMGTGKEWRL